MSIDCKKIQSAIERRFTESIEPQAQQRIDAHVKDCAECRAFASETASVLAFASKSIVPEQSEEFWDSYYDKLADRIDSDQAKVISRSAPTAFSLKQLSRLLPQRRPAMQFALAAALLVIGILIGKVLFDSDPTSQPRQITGLAEDGTQGVQLTSLNERTDRFLDRSKVLLLGMVNMDLDETEAEDVDLSRTRSVAHELVKESGPLRGELEDADQQRLMKLIDDLEVILLQIANLEEDADIPAIEMVKDGVDQRAVLLKINVSEMRSRQRGDGS